jgi:hypothetical protein
MAKQPAKKTTTKKTVAKSATAKKTPVKKTAAKKVSTPVVEKHACGCNHECACGTGCKCRKGGFWKKLILFIIVFALGFSAAKLCCCDKRGKMGPRPEFENGCLVVKCPKMAQMAQIMDINQDGCVSKDEFKAAKKQFKAKKHERKLAEQQPEQVTQTVVTE